MNLELSYTSALLAQLLFWLMSVGFLLLKVTVIAGVAFLIARAMKLRPHQFSSAHRHHVWAIALGSILMLTAMTAIVPSVDARVQANSMVASILRMLPSAQPGETSGDLAWRGGSFPTPGSIVGPRLDANNEGPMRTVRVLRIDSTDVPQTRHSVSYDAAMSGFRINAAVLLTWLLGTVFLLARLINSHRKLAKIVKRALIATDAAVIDSAQQIAQRMKLGRLPRVLIHANIQTPCMAGWLRPIVLLPERSREWSHERICAVLSHEFAHVSRNDYLTQLVASITCAVYWFHPGVWMAARQLRNECERAADDCAIACMPSVQYAEHLLALADRALSAPHTPTVALGMARKSQLESRIRAMLLTGMSRATISTRSRRLTNASALMLLVPVSALSPGGNIERTQITDGHRESLHVAPLGTDVFPNQSRPQQSSNAAGDTVIDRMITVSSTDIFTMNIDEAANLVFRESNEATVRVRAALALDRDVKNQFALRRIPNGAAFVARANQAATDGAHRPSYEIWMPANLSVFVLPSSANSITHFKVSGVKTTHGARDIEIEGSISTSCVSTVVAHIVANIRNKLSCGPDTFPASRYEKLRVLVNGAARSDSIFTLTAGGEVQLKFSKSLSNPPANKKENPAR